MDVEDNDVMIYYDDEAGQPQPSTFRLCPLGVQFYASHPIAECSLIELTLAVPGTADDHSEPVKCVGYIAQCCAPDNGSDMFRIWVKFLDLTSEIQDRLQTVCNARQLKCPFCENF